jgi:hypothetical protein
MSLGPDGMKINRTLDSINQLRDSSLFDLNKKLQSIKDNSIGKLKDLNLRPKLSDKALDVTDNINN